MALDIEVKPADNSSEQKAVNPELEKMLKEGLHFGYSRSRRHPKMGNYLFGVKNNVEVFDLEKTNECLTAAEAYLEKLGREGKIFLWVGCKLSIRHLVEKAGKESGAPYVAERWLGGILTNAKVLRERLRYFLDLRMKKETGELAKYTKKEQSKILRDLSKLERYFGGIQTLKESADALVIVDPKEENTAWREARQMNIPVVGIMSSDSDPSTVSYPIPANDFAPGSVGYILERLSRAYRAGLASSGAEEK